MPFRVPRAIVYFALIAATAALAQTPATEPVAPTLDGPTLFANSGCPQCHGAAGQGTAKAPSLRDVRKRKTEDEIKSQIKDGGKMMPPFGEALTDEQIAKLVEYLRSKDAWKNTPVASSQAH